MCSAERENLMLAFEWAITREDADAVVTLYRATGMYWRMVGAIEQGVRWGEAAVAAAASLGDDHRRMLALLSLSEYPRHSGNPQRALALKAEALALARALDDGPVIAVILDDLASMSADQGDVAAAHAYLAEAQAIHDVGSRDSMPDRAHTLVTRAEVALAEGDVVEAQQRLDELAELEAGTMQLPDWIVECDCLRAKTLHAAGHDDRAVALFRTVVRSAGDLGYRMPMIEAIDALAAIDVGSHPDRSARLLGMADRLRAEARLAIGDRSQYERTIDIARVKLGRASFEQLHATGRSLTMAAIVDDVLASA
jgi:tetratricopeptide (TPR) repeat protein